MPFVSDLSARDFTLLQRAGWMPVGLAFGASFVYAPRRTAGTAMKQTRQNVELTNYTEAMYSARESAMEKMQRSALEVGGRGRGRGEGHRGPDELRPPRHRLHGLGHGGQARGRGAPVRPARRWSSRSTTRWSPSRQRACAAQPKERDGSDEHAQGSGGAGLGRLGPHLRVDRRAGRLRRAVRPGRAVLRPGDPVDHRPAQGGAGHRRHLPGLEPAGGPDPRRRATGPSSSGRGRRPSTPARARPACRSP